MVQKELGREVKRRRGRTKTSSAHLARPSPHVGLRGVLRECDIQATRQLSFFRCLCFGFLSETVFDSLDRVWQLFSGHPIFRNAPVSS